MTVAAPRTESAVRASGSLPFPMAAVLAAGAGIIHVKAAIDHGSHWWAFGVFFGLLVCFQLGWALLVWRGRRDARLLDAAIYVSLATAAICLLSRIVGVPFGPWAWDAEPIGALDLIATLDELALAALLVSLRHPDSRVGRALAWTHGPHVVRLGVMLGTASVMSLLFSSHSHT
jgi:hypothetical protein